MNEVRLTETHLLPSRIQRTRMAAYVMTIVTCMVCGGTFYLSLQAQSQYRSFLKNATLAEHGWSNKDNRTDLLSRVIQSNRTEDCANTSMNNPLLLIGSIVCITIRAALFGMQSRRLVDIGLFLNCYDVCCVVRSAVTFLQLTDCYLKLYEIISILPVNDYFRFSFQTTVQPYYEVSMLFFWFLFWLCVMNFLLSFCRSTIDNDDNWVDCNKNWAEVPEIWFYDYVTMKMKRRQPAVLRALASRRRRTATTRRLRTKYLLSESIKKIF
ncbi:uncharacterized protein LOC111031286 [Myzus persicae]|uniref:uncharacterized protein LOC111031286 n=1 Tax=Myzus persicae TaxID=13164 RepID=UPI000B939746|nr:uncharacterized protein LOC111031286 [Myzus persicae]